MQRASVLFRIFASLFKMNPASISLLCLYQVWIGRWSSHPRWVGDGALTFGSLCVKAEAQPSPWPTISLGVLPSQLQWVQSVGAWQCCMDSFGNKRTQAAHHPQERKEVLQIQLHPWVDAEEGGWVWAHLGVDHRIHTCAASHRSRGAVSLGGRKSGLPRPDFLRLVSHIVRLLSVPNIKKNIV